MRSALCAGERRAIHQVHNGALVLTDNGGVGLGSEVADGARVPVVAARKSAGFIHALLHDGPFTAALTTKVWR